jgi:hypothetical protein
MRKIAFLMATFLLTGSVLAAPPPKARPYHLELELTPGTAFPYLGKFGKTDLHVYAGGVRGEALWLHGFSRNGASAVTVVNPLARMYMEVPTADIVNILTRLAGDPSAQERKVKPMLLAPVKGKVKGIDATRYRLQYGPATFIDVWTTTVIPQNSQLRLLINEAVGGVAPGTASVASKLPGTPIYVELNFRRFQKVAIVQFKKLTFAADDEADALTLGKGYIRASILEKLFEGH